MDIVKTLIHISMGLLACIAALSLFYSFRKRQPDKKQSTIVSVVVMLVMILLINTLAQLDANFAKNNEVLIVISTSSNGITVQDPSDLSLGSRIILCDSTGLAVDDIVNGNGRLVLEAKYVYRIGE